MVSDVPLRSTHSTGPGARLIRGAGGMSLAATTFNGPAHSMQRGPVVFAHGFGQTRGAWNRAGAALAEKGFTGQSYDARGHGESERNAPEVRYSVEQFADDLIIIAGEHRQPPVLIGASMGGLFGLVGEARWPGLFRALILVDVTPRWEQAGLERILAFMTAFPDGFDSLAHAADVVAAYLPHRRTRKSPQELKELLREDQQGRWKWHWDPRLLDEVIGDPAAHHAALAAAARAVRCPVLLISGGRSDLVSRQTVEEFETLVPHATHVHLPEATHMLAGDDNDTFTATVLRYLLELPVTVAEMMPADAGEPAVTKSVPGAIA